MGEQTFENMQNHKRRGEPMNDCIKVITDRRTIRAYKKEQIKDSDLQQILDCAILAPNAMNAQTWHFTVVQNREMLDQFVETIKANIMNSGIPPLIEKASDPNYHTFYHAPTVIIISGDPEAKFIQIDCGAAAQNIALAAKSLNIGSCVMTSPVFLFASDNKEAIKKELCIPEKYEYVCAVALGYMDGDNPPVPPRKKDVFNTIF
jgi:nitroreductase